jgi:hypothetical protein
MLKHRCSGPSFPAYYAHEILKEHGVEDYLFIDTSEIYPEGNNSYSIFVIHKEEDANLLRLACPEVFHIEKIVDIMNTPEYRS